MSWLDMLVYIGLIFGIFLSGMLLGYAKGRLDRIDDYDKYLDEMHSHYKKQFKKMRDMIDPGDAWKFK